MSKQYYTKICSHTYKYYSNKMENLWTIHKCVKILWEDYENFSSIVWLNVYSFGLELQTWRTQNSIRRSAFSWHQLLPDGARVGKVIVPEPGGVSFNKDVRVNNLNASDWQVPRNPALSLVEIEPEWSFENASIHPTIGSQKQLF